MTGAIKATTIDDGTPYPYKIGQHVVITSGVLKGANACITRLYVDHAYLSFKLGEPDEDVRFSYEDFRPQGYLDTQPIPDIDNEYAVGDLVEITKNNSMMGILAKITKIFPTYVHLVLRGHTAEEIATYDEFRPHVRVPYKSPTIDFQAGAVNTNPSVSRRFPADRPTVSAAPRMDNDVDLRAGGINIIDPKDPSKILSKEVLERLYPLDPDTMVDLEDGGIYRPITPHRGYTADEWSGIVHPLAEDSKIPVDQQESRHYRANVVGGRQQGKTLLKQINTLFVEIGSRVDAIETKIKSLNELLGSNENSEGN